MEYLKPPVKDKLSCLAALEVIFCTGYCSHDLTICLSGISDVGGWCSGRNSASLGGFSDFQEEQKAQINHVVDGIYGGFISQVRFGDL